MFVKLKRNATVPKKQKKIRTKQGLCMLKIIDMFQTSSSCGNWHAVLQQLQPWSGCATAPRRGPKWQELPCVWARRADVSSLGACARARRGVPFALLIAASVCDGETTLARARRSGGRPPDCHPSSFTAPGVPLALARFDALARGKCSFPVTVPNSL